jgi:hypothetical protein
VDGPALAGTGVSPAYSWSRLGQVQLGLDAIQKVKHTAQWVLVHLEEPKHELADAAAGIRDQLAGLERRLSNLEARLLT